LRITLGHVHDQFVEELIGNPVVGERHLAVLAFDELDLTAVTAVQPVDELGGVTNRG
jgi:hypothetical protein